jgi:hypothetical protein
MVPPPATYKSVRMLLNQPWKHVGGCLELVQIRSWHQLRDYANIWLNRDCYLTFFDEIREKISHPCDHPKVFEIHEMFRVWILMMVHGVTAQGLYIQTQNGILKCWT